jgi:hypothetical protein
MTLRAMAGAIVVGVLATLPVGAYPVGPKQDRCLAAARTAYRVRIEDCGTNNRVVTYEQGRACVDAADQEHRVATRQCRDVTQWTGGQP